MYGEILGYGRRAKVRCEFTPAEASVLGNAALSKSLDVADESVTKQGSNNIFFEEDGTAWGEVQLNWSEKWLTETAQMVFDYQARLSNIIQKHHRELGDTAIGFLQHQYGGALRLGLDIDKFTSEVHPDAD
ncbi:MAG: hypothetical protein ABI220_01165 [Candidatus Saccharimonadales bacterium]